MSDLAIQLSVSQFKQNAAKLDKIGKPRKPVFQNNSVTMQELMREYLARDTECTMQLNTSMGNVDSEFLQSFASKEPAKLDDIVPHNHASIIPPQRRP